MASVRQRTFRARLCVFLDCSQLHKRGVRMDLLPKTPRQSQVFAASWVLAFGTSITRCLRVWLAVTKAETGLRAMNFSVQLSRWTLSSATKLLSRIPEQWTAPTVAWQTGTGNEHSFVGYNFKCLCCVTEHRMELREIV